MRRWMAVLAVTAVVVGAGIAMALAQGGATAGPTAQMALPGADDKWRYVSR